MTKYEYWVYWASFGASFLFGLYWVIRWAIEDALGLLK